MTHLSYIIKLLKKFDNNLKLHKKKKYLSFILLKNVLKYDTTFSDARRRLLFENIKQIQMIIAILMNIHVPILSF